MESLKDYLARNKISNYSFANANGYSPQYIGQIIKEGKHFVVDGKLVRVDEKKVLNC